MVWIRCPQCKSSTSVYEDNYSGTLQCSSCANVLRVIIKNSIVVDVTLNVPGGPDVQGLPPDIEEAYSETRRCIGAKCYTASELLCRKILMHVAVEKGAKEGDSFVSYLTFMENNGFVAPQMRTWLDLIRRHGNEAAHRLQQPDKERAESTVTFTAELLRLIYEMDFMARKFTSKP